MRLQFNNVPSEKNISSILITDENTTTPLMEITLKSAELAKQYRNSLLLCLKMNEACISDGHNTEPFNFTVTTANNTITIHGNIFNALKRMLADKLISAFTCDTMLLNDIDNPKLLEFFQKNKRFALPVIEDEISVNGNGSPHAEQHQKPSPGINT